MITNDQKREMIDLRAQGWSTVALGIRYGVDHTTIIYHLRYPERQVRGRRPKEGQPVRQPNPEYHPSRMVEVRPRRHASAHAIFIKPRRSYEEHLRLAAMRVVIRSDQGVVISVGINEDAKPKADALVREYRRLRAVHNSNWPPSGMIDLHGFSTA